MARLYDRARTEHSKAFLEELVSTVHYGIHTVLTDNGIQFADLPKNRTGPTAMLRRHPFDRVCWKYGIEHRLTKPNHPWTNGQVERMNRTLKEATVNRDFYQNHDQSKEHLATFIAAYNFAKRFKTLQASRLPSLSLWSTPSFVYKDRLRKSKLNQAVLNPACGVGG